MSSKIYDYSSVCSSIMDLDPKIRFVGIINERGRLVAGGMRENVVPLENEKDDEMMFMELALRVKMRRDFDAQLGKVRFALASRERVIAISIPLNDDILYIVTEPDGDYGGLPKKILKIVHA